MDKKMTKTADFMMPAVMSMNFRCLQLYNADASTQRLVSVWSEQIGFNRMDSRVFILTISAVFFAVYSRSLRVGESTGAQM